MQKNHEGSDTMEPVDIHRQTHIHEKEKRCHTVMNKALISQTGVKCARVCYIISEEDTVQAERTDGLLNEV